MATTIASPVTLAVPAIRARMPYSGASSSLGSQYAEVKNSFRSRVSKTNAEALLGDEDEDADDEQDGRYTAQEDHPLYHLVDIPVGVAAIETVTVTRASVFARASSTAAISRPPDRAAVP